MRPILLIFGVSALAAGLTSCFDSPFSTNATVTLGNGSGAAVLTGTTESSGRTSAAFDPNAPYAQAMAASTGAIAGSSAVFPPGALSLAADIFIEEGSNLAGSSAFTDLGLGATNAISAAGASVIIRPSVDAALTVPMALSLPLPSGYGLWGISDDHFGMNLLLGDSDDRLAILAKVWDPASSSLQTILIPPSEIKNENGKATFETKFFGAFQTVLMANPVTERVEAKASEPVTNSAGISVVATAGIVNQSSIAVTETLRALTLAGSPTLSYDSETRAAKVTATLSESVATSACTLALRNQGKSDVLWTTGNNKAAASASQQISAIIPASVAGTMEAAISCNAVDGRSVKSSWAYLGKVCASGFFGANCVACAAGTYWNSASLACAPVANLANFPVGTNNITEFSGSVSGTGISSYLFKVGAYGESACANANDYATSSAAGGSAAGGGNGLPAITKDISSLPDGAVTVCVVGVDSNGIQQTYTSAASRTWTKDTLAPAPPAIVSAAGKTNVTSVIYTNGLVPVIAGTAEANATVTVYNGGTTLGTATVNSAGLWTYTPSASMTIGTYTLTAKATDSAANQGSASTSVTLIIDNQAPAAPSITSVAGNTSVASGIYTNILVPVIAGTAENNATVTLYNGNTILVTVAANGSGAWTHTPTSDLAAGTHTITTKATDAASNQSPASAVVTVIIDTTAPPAPGITSVAAKTNISDTLYTNNLAPVIAGTAEANATVTIYDGGTTLGSATVNGSGAWSYTPTSNLPAGNYTITAKAMDAASNISAASITVNLVIDATPPAAPAITSVAENTGVASTIYTNVTLPQIKGSAEANAEVTIYKDSTVFGTTTASTAEAWAFTSTTNLAAGTYSLTAKAKDAALNLGPVSTAVTVVIDTTAPAAVISGFPTDASNSTVMQITVAVTDGVTHYRFRIDAGAASAVCNVALTAYSDETAVATLITSNLSSLNIADGPVTVCVIGRDAAGNWQGATAALATNKSWTKDTIAPVAVLAGQPSGSSSVAALNVTVTSATNYKYKVGNSSTTNCADTTDYSASTAIATAITASLSAVTPGVTGRLCVIGVDAAGNWQAESSATGATWTKSCALGNYPSSGSCVVVGTGNYSANGLDRFACSNVPGNASYSTNNSTSATCPWSCNVNYLLNASQTGCDYRPNTQTVSCPSGQVIVGAAVRSGGWMDKLGVRCQTFTNGALAGAITDGPAYGGTGGSPYTFDCSAGSYLYKITGGNGTGSSTPQSTYLANIKFYCRSLTTDLLTNTSLQFGTSAGMTPFDYFCAVSKPITSIPFDSAGAYVGTILQAYCGSNLK